MNNKNLPSKIEKKEAYDFYKNDEGEIFVSSLYVAKITNKESKIVTRDIRKIIDSDVKFGEYTFVLSSYLAGANKKSYNFYWMTEDGCSILLGGYSVEHRIKIQKELRAYKKGDKTLLPETKIKAVEMYLEELKANEKKQKLINKTKPYIALLKRLIKNRDNILIRIAAKVLSDEDNPIGEITLYKKLRDWGLVLKDEKEPSQSSIDRGYLIYAMYPRSGTGTTQVTPRGLIYIGMKLMKEQYNVDELNIIIEEIENNTFDITKYE